MFMQQYDKHMMRAVRKGSGRIQLEWERRPSLELSARLRLQNQCWATKRGTTETELRQFLSGMVNGLVLGVFEGGGLGREQWD